METRFEKDNVSNFRKYVREKRFNQPLYKKYIESLLTRINQDDLPHIELVLAKSEQVGTSTLFDSLGVGKTDFTYFFSNYCRHNFQDINILAFPDIFNQERIKQNFYNSIFVPEVIRLTRNFSDKFNDWCSFFIIPIRSIVMRSLLLLRLNILLTVTFVAFIIGAISFQDIFKYQPEIIQITSYKLTPLFIVLFIISWIFVLWDKAKNDKEFLHEWNENSIKDLKRTLAIESSCVQPMQIAKRFGQKTTVIIIDDANQIDAESLSNLIELVSSPQNNNNKSEIGLVLICDSSQIEFPSAFTNNSVRELLNEYKCRRNNWLCFTLLPPTIEEIEWYLWGFYDNDKAWNNIKKLLDFEPAIRMNPGFLMQFIYDETSVLENNKSDLININFSEMVDDYRAFSIGYKSQAEIILGKIPIDDMLPCKEIIKYILAFESPIKNMEIINMLMEENGYPNINHFLNLLSENLIIKISDGDYTFVKASDRNTLLLNWAEWKDNSSAYYLTVFNKIHDCSSHRKLVDNPKLAKKCSPSYLIVDTLWREADALWFYGGNTDIHSALEFYGLENGAIAKWHQLFINDISNGSIVNENFFWSVKAKNSPYRYNNTNRSVRSESFIGDLLQIASSLYFSAGDFEKAFIILTSMWNEIKQACWNSSDVSEKIKEKIKAADIKIQFQLFEYLITGPISNNNWKQATSICEQLSKEKLSSEMESALKINLWRLKHLHEFGVGNLPTPLSLIREDNLISPSQNKDIKKNEPNLLISQISLSFLHDCILFLLKDPSKKNDIPFVLKKLKTATDDFNKDICQFRKQVNLALKTPYPIIKSSYFPIADTETQLLIHKGLFFYYTGFILSLEFSQDDDANKFSYNIDKVEKSIKEDFDLSEKVWEIYEPSKYEIECSNEVILLKKKFDDLRDKYLFSKELNRQEIRNINIELRKILQRLVLELKRNYCYESFRLLKLASDLASIKLQSFDETQANYFQTMVIIELSLIDIQLERKNNYFQQFSELITRTDININNYLGGYLLDSLRYHTLIAEAFGERSFQSAYQQYDIGIDICNRLEVYIPSIIKGQIITNQLNLIGNMGEFVAPDHILLLANQALKIINEYNGDGITKDDLEFHKAEIRWWIAEACVRLASREIGKVVEKENEIKKLTVEKYYENAQTHINWINRQSKNNAIINKVFIPKIKQVQSHFLSISGNNTQAVKLLREALIEFGSDLFEQIQTLERIIEIELNNLQNSNNKEQIQNFFGNLMNFRLSLMNARDHIVKEHNQTMLYYKAAEGAITYAHTVLFTNLRNNSQFADYALDFWLFGIKGILSWGLAGKAAIQLMELKALSYEIKSIHLPDEFNYLVKQCVTHWDPRHEMTNKMDVEKALGSLIGKNVNIQDIIDPCSDKLETITQAQVLLSRPTPDIKNAYLVLSSKLNLIDYNNPVSEDVDLIRLILFCCKEVDFEKVQEFNQILINLSNSLACKIYIEIADAFSDSPEIRDRYLHMAAIIGNNKFADEANRKISHVINHVGIRKSDFTKDELEKIQYSRLMKLPIEKYNITEAYNLLFLFENELRRLIAFQFSQRNGWWKKGIPLDIFERVARENNENIKGVELLNSVTLGDLFKIILYPVNWDQIFQSIFLSRKLIEARQSLILPIRNRIAHTDPGLSEDSIEEYVIGVKNMINQIQPYLTL